MRIEILERDLGRLSMPVPMAAPRPTFPVPSATSAASPTATTSKGTSP
jgi:hypothetical protein